MSETIVRFNLTELKKVRLRCTKCSAIVELPIESIPVLAKDGRCYVCHETLFPHAPGTSADALYRLNLAFESLRDVADRVEIQFELLTEKISFGRA